MAISLLVVGCEQLPSGLAMHVLASSFVHLAICVLIPVSASMIYIGKPSGIEISSIQLLLLSIIGISVYMPMFRAIAINYMPGLIEGVPGSMWKPSEGERRPQPG